MRPDKMSREQAEQWLDTLHNEHPDERDCVHGHLGCSYVGGHAVCIDEFLGVWGVELGEVDDEI